MDNNNGDNKRVIDNFGRRYYYNDQSNDIAGSPGSHSNSSSSRQNRIVELLPDNEEQPAQWIISAEFYDEDVAQGLSSDETDDEFIDDILEDAMDDEEDSDDEDLGRDMILDAGFVLAPDEDEQSSSSESDGDLGQDANYDTTLPVNHHYLGDNLEESRGRQVLVESSIINLPLFNMGHVILLPGQKLPITTSSLNPRIQMFMKACIERGSTTIGLMSDPQNNSIGTTAEIRSHLTAEDELRIIMEGRQRFKLISAPFETAIMANIKILPEITLGRPYPRISSLDRFANKIDTNKRYIVSKHPHWVLKQYEARNVMVRILDQIKDWCSADLTRDPNDFSYWVASNLPISNNERLLALSFGCAEARLLWLLDMLEKSELFVCSTCKNVICDKKDVFPMSLSGPQNSYVNSHGFVHETLTVLKTRGLIQEYGNWSTEFTWFPGYAWRMTNCGTCNRHIGWCYKSEKPETKPRKFFGLSRTNVRLSAPTPDMM